MANQLIDLFNKVAETVALTARNTIDNNDGITLRFSVSVPGHVAGAVATISAAQARVYIAAHQAVAAI